MTVFTEPPDDFEMADVKLPDGVAALSAPARAALVLEVMHAAAIRLAEARGWDPAAFEAARAHVVEQGMKTEVEELPPVKVRDSPESLPYICVGGGSTDDAVPETYETALSLLYDELRGAAWAAWWCGAPDDVLDISYDLTAEHPARITARWGGNKLRVRIDRPLADILAATERVALARADVEAMAATVRRRARLGPHPDLPGLTALTAATEEQIEQRAVLVRRMHALLDRLADRLPASLVRILHADLAEGRTGDTMSALRVQLARLGAELTGAERAEFDALAASQR